MVTAKMTVHLEAGTIDKNTCHSQFSMDTARNHDELFFFFPTKDFPQIALIHVANPLLFLDVRSPMYRCLAQMRSPFDTGAQGEEKKKKKKKKKKTHQSVKAMNKLPGPPFSNP